MKYIEHYVVNHALPIRLDRYLRTINPLITQGMLEKLLRSKKILVNGKKAKSGDKILNHHMLLIDNILYKDLMEYSQKKISIHSMQDKVVAGKILKDYLIFENDKFIAINKPSGISTQGGSKVNVSIDGGLSFLRENGMDYKIVHRLDKDTSGILLIAKTRDVAIKFMHLFQNHHINKKYHAILEHIPEKQEGTIQSYLIKEKDFVVSSYPEEVVGSKVAITHYKVVKTFAPYALVEFAPQTGRMHQLRVHAQLIGCPIVGDVKYGNIEAKSMMLHAKHINIDDIFFGKIAIEAKYPDEFLEFQSQD